MLKVGDKVHYIPFSDCDESIIENGIVKSLQNEEYCFVVFHWSDTPEKYQDFTGQRTDIKSLKKGWI